MTALDVLEHHGILGMKWGIRRDRSSGGSHHTTSSTESAHRPAAEPTHVPSSVKGHGVFSKKLAKKSPAPKVVSEDAKLFKEISTKARTHGLHSLTNAELKKFNERFDMEKKYSKLEAEMKTKKNGVGKRIAKKVLESMADRALSSIAGHVVDAHVEKFKTGPTVARMLPKDKASRDAARKAATGW